MAKQCFGRLQEEPPEGAVDGERARSGEAAEGVDAHRHVWTSGTRRRLRAPAAPPPGALHGPVEGVLPAWGAPCSGTSLLCFLSSRFSLDRFILSLGVFAHQKNN